LPESVTTPFFPEITGGDHNLKGALLLAYTIAVQVMVNKHPTSSNDLILFFFMVLLLFVAVLVYASLSSHGSGKKLKHNSKKCK
jgi:hypothetical protein